MQINRNNFEEHAIDWLEGNLKGEELKSMEAFLSANPDVRAELTGLYEIVLKAPETVYTKKEQLKKKEKGVFQWVLLLSLLLIPAVILFSYIVMPEYNQQHLSESAQLENINTKKTLQQTNIGEKPKTADLKEALKHAESKKSDIKTEKKADFSNKSPAKADAEYNVKNPNLNSGEEPLDTMIKMPEQTKKSETDSLKRVLDSIHQLNGKPKIEWGYQPIAALDAKHIEFKNNIDVAVSKLLIETMVLDFKPENGQAFTVRKSKGIKTPFGTIRFKEIVEALLPESYMASVK